MTRRRRDAMGSVLAYQWPWITISVMCDISPLQPLNSILLDVHETEALATSRQSLGPDEVLQATAARKKEILYTAR